MWLSVSPDFGLGFFVGWIHNKHLNFPSENAWINRVGALA